MFSQLYDQMNQNYGSVHYWPQPYHYSSWYNNLIPQYQVSYLKPLDYGALYQFAIQKYQSDIIANKPKKLTRNQKRKLKKKQLEEELQKQKKQIGNWVKLQRKDLYQQLQKIEVQQKKARQKKQEKLSHLIQIHKQVFKFYRKRDGAKQVPSKRIHRDKTKKRLSYIKKMKKIYQQSRQKTLQMIKQQQWQSDEEEAIQNEKPKQIKANIVQTSLKDLQKIQYMETGKLTGHNYQGILLRQWVRNVPSEQLQDIALRLINRLAYKQAIKKVQKPQKYKKLIVSGIKQTKRTLKTIIDKNKAKLLIIALNIQRNPLKRGVDDEILNIITLATAMKIPIINTSTRAKLGRAFTGKFGPRLTTISIINFEGYQDMIDQLLLKWRQSCTKYNII